MHLTGYIYEDYYDTRSLEHKVMRSISCARIPYNDMLFRNGSTQLGLIIEAFHWSGALYKNDLSVLT